MGGEGGKERRPKESEKNARSIKGEDQVHRRTGVRSLNLQSKTRLSSSPFSLNFLYFEKHIR